MVDQILLTHRDLKGHDPIESLISTRATKIIPMPFNLAQLKMRHKKLLMSLNPKLDADELSVGCSSIDSDTYKPKFPTKAGSKQKEIDSRNEKQQNK